MEKSCFLVIASIIIGCCWLMTLSDAADVVFDNTPGYGRTFEGIGGISGGGATSKLLVNYPKAQRDQILDYLFKPNFGANLQILKVEIGGDAQSTDGTEASHMHNSWDENYERGYEWWLMVEAKKRNPNIKLYGLPWGFPGWLGHGTNNPYSNPGVLADYIVRWINGAKTHHNLTIDFIGIWNERNYNIQYIKTLRNVLDQRGFQNVQIIASEDYSTFNDEVGAGCWARILNQNYVNGHMTSTISWNLIASYYAGLPYERDGLMTAEEPWTGHYVVQSPIWISAHTTQFTSIGWKYLAHGNGVGKLANGGSYVALASPSGADLTIIIETMTHDHSVCIRPNLSPYSVTAQTITIILKGSFAKITQLHVWYSKLGFNGVASNTFTNKGPITITNGQAQLSLGLDEVYTLTTLSTGVKGSYPAPPASAQFPFPYKDDFEGSSLYAEPNNLAPQTGSFEVLRNAANNHFIRQTVLYSPVAWCDAEKVNKTIALIGAHAWADVFVETDFAFPDVNATDGVYVAARVDRGGCGAMSTRGIFLFAFKNNYILSNDLARKTVLHQGLLPPGNGWHKLSLQLQGRTATGAYDGKNIFSVDVPNNPANGFAALGTDTFGVADFDNLNIARRG